MAEWTYASAVFAMIPYGIEPVSVAMDSQGIRSDALRKTLEEWNEETRHMPRCVVYCSTNVIETQQIDV
jgi:aromatic amino acid aminotransferase I / 2-aminoadipate transaminase